MKSVPNYIQDTGFYTSAACQNLIRLGGLEFVGAYQFLIGLCLNSPGYYEEIQKGEYRNVIKILGFRESKFLRFVDAILGLNLASRSDRNGVEIDLVTQRKLSFNAVCVRNSKNRTSQENRNPSKQKEEVQPVVNESSTSGTTTTTTPTLNSFPKGGSKGGLPHTPESVIELLGQTTFESLVVRFDAEGINLQEMREALIHAAAKLDADPNFHLQSWLSRYGPGVCKDKQIKDARRKRELDPFKKPTNLDRTMEVVGRSIARNSTGKVGGFTDILQIDGGRRGQI